MFVCFFDEKEWSNVQISTCKFCNILGIKQFRWLKVILVCNKDKNCIKIHCEGFMRLVEVVKRNNHGWCQNLGWWL
jgi:hypothetical protein